MKIFHSLISQIINRILTFKDQITLKTQEEFNG